MGGRDLLFGEWMDALGINTEAIVLICGLALGVGGSF